MRFESDSIPGRLQTFLEAVEYRDMVTAVSKLFFVFIYYNHIVFFYTVFYAFSVLSPMNKQKETSRGDPSRRSPVHELWI